MHVVIINFRGSLFPFVHLCRSRSTTKTPTKPVLFITLSYHGLIHHIIMPWPYSSHYHATVLFITLSYHDLIHHIIIPRSYSSHYHTTVLFITLSCHGLIHHIIMPRSFSSHYHTMWYHTTHRPSSCKTPTKLLPCLLCRPVMLPALTNMVIYYYMTLHRSRSCKKTQTPTKLLPPSSHEASTPSQTTQASQPCRRSWETRFDAWRSCRCVCVCVCLCLCLCLCISCMFNVWVCLSLCEDISVCVCVCVCVCERATWRPCRCVVKAGGGRHVCMSWMGNRVRISRYAWLLTAVMSCVPMILQCTCKNELLTSEVDKQHG